jgi:hypothetical protein
VFWEATFRKWWWHTYPYQGIFTQTCIISAAHCTSKGIQTSVFRSISLITVILNQQHAVTVSIKGVSIAIFHFQLAELWNVRGLTWAVILDWDARIQEQCGLRSRRFGMWRRASWYVSINVLRNLLTSYSSLNRSQQLPSKHGNCTKLYNITSQKSVFSILQQSASLLLRLKALDTTDSERHCPWYFWVVRRKALHVIYKRVLTLGCWLIFSLYGFIMIFWQTVKGEPQITFYHIYQKDAHNKTTNALYLPDWCIGVWTSFYFRLPEGGASVPKHVGVMCCIHRAFLLNWTIFTNKWTQYSVVCCRWL